MAKRVLSHDPASGITEYHSYDQATGNTIIETVQDVEPFLDRSRHLAKDTSYTKRGIKNDMWHVASIPVVIQHKWLKEYGLDIYDKNNKARVLKMLDSPEWRYLKTTAGKIGVPDCIKH